MWIFFILEFQSSIVYNAGILNRRGELTRELKWHPRQLRRELSLFPFAPQNLLDKNLQQTDCPSVLCFMLCAQKWKGNCATQLSY